MKKQFCLILFVIFCAFLYAVPVLKVRRMVTLSTGENIMVTSCGDENISFFVTDDEKVVELNDGVYELTGMDVQQYLDLHTSKYRKAPRKIGSLASALIKPYGVKRIPVVLVQFQDKKMTTGYDSLDTNNYWTKFCNGTMDGKPYYGHGSVASVRDYFIQQSRGQFMPEFKVVGPVLLDNGYAYYGKDSGSKDINYSQFVKESLQKALLNLDDWKQFDNDGDGTVDATVLIYAGLGQNYTNSFGDPNTIWPKETATTCTVGDVVFVGCFSTCEMHPTGASGGVITDWIPDGTGVFIHEMSHALGLPDFYDTRNKAYGMDYWSVMDYGQYASNSYAPVGYTSYERDFMGWQPLVTLDEPCTVRIKCFAKGGEGYKIVNAANKNEYYILDNRQAFGADSVLCGTKRHGLLVTHVDYSSSAWTGNSLNTDPNHQRMTIIPANNKLVGSNNYSANGGSSGWFDSMAGNVYPGSTKNTELTNESTPASIVYTGGFMNQPIYDIEEHEDHTITLKFNPIGTLEAPEDLQCTDLSGSEFSIVWNKVPEAEWYNVALYADNQLVLQLDSIDSNSYHLDNLTPHTDYSFTVQALADKYRNSKVVRSQIYTTTEDAIAAISEHGSVVSVYNISGQFIQDCNTDDITNLELKSGIYLLHYKNGKIRKILIH